MFFNFLNWFKALMLILPVEETKDVVFRHDVPNLPEKRKSWSAVT